MAQSPPNSTCPPPPSPRSRRLRWIGRLRAGIVIAALALLSAADRAGWLLASRPDGDLYHLISARVVRVIDGDTIEVRLADHIMRTDTTRVRLIGIDCPEIAHPTYSALPADPFADEATALMRDLVEDRVVTLRLEPQRTRDRYDRLLAHVDLEDGTSVAEQLLSEGLARQDDRWNHSMLMRYRQLELSARRAGRGMWP